MQTRYSKPLDIRKHKKDWLSFAALRERQVENERFARFVLEHPNRVSVDGCPVCTSRAFKNFAVTYGIPYVQCDDCTHVFSRVMLRDDDLAAHYRDEYAEGSVYVDRTQVESRNRMVLEPKLFFITPHVRTSRRRWLDVGTGNGAMVWMAGKNGFDAHGLEMGKASVQFAKDVFGLTLGTHVLAEELRRAGPKSYDVVSFFMVLEHVSDPRAELRAARDIVADDGLFVIEVPKADSVACMGDISFPDSGLRQLNNNHFMNYTMRSIERLLSDHGFVPEAAWFMGQDIFNTVIHLSLLDSKFVGSKLYDFLIDHDNELQNVVDRAGLSDEVIVVARKQS
jgi:2-polyprenyl-3-methyl-5-hydroxy-6-metoxy-1,4-benzoquinol methylase